MSLKKFFSLLIAVAVLLIVNISSCNAEPTYETANDVPIPGCHRYGAWVSDVFFQYNRVIGIHIEKANIIKDGSPYDFYSYVIEINQLTNNNPFNVKSVLIMSETDSVEIPANNPKRFNGLDLVTDRIIYYYDPGKVNQVIKSVWSKMLIRITTTRGTIYDFYPSIRYINYAKRVADWASR